MRTSLLLGVLGLALLAGALPSHSAEKAEIPQLTLVRVSYGNGWDALPAVFAIERGHLVREGLLVSGHNVTSANAIINSLSAGSTDFAVIPQRTVLAMAGAKAPITVVAISGWGTPIACVARKDLEGEGIAALKGKVVAVGRGSAAHPVLVRLLNANSVAPSEVTIRILTADGLMGAIEAGEADAACESGHFTQKLIAGENTKTLISNEQIVEQIGYVGADALVVSNELLESRPEVVQDFVLGWVKALQAMTDDPEDAGKVLQLFFHRQGVIVPDLQARQWATLTRYDRYVWTDADVADAEYNGWGLREGGLFRIEPKLEGYIQNRFAEKALEEVGKATPNPASAAD